MPEYIEREAVLKIIGDNCPHDKGGYNTEEEMEVGATCYYIMKDVDNIPTADVVPRSEYDDLKMQFTELDIECDRLEKVEENYHKLENEVEQLQRNLEQCENGYRQQMHLMECKHKDEIKKIFEFMDDLFNRYRVNTYGSCYYSAGIITEYKELKKKNKGE